MKLDDSINNNSSIMIHNNNKLFKLTSIEHLINNIPNRGRHRVNNWWYKIIKLMYNRWSAVNTDVYLILGLSSNELILLCNIKHKIHIHANSSITDDNSSFMEDRIVFKI